MSTRSLGGSNHSLLSSGSSHHRRRSSQLSANNPIKSDPGLLSLLTELDCLAVSANQATEFEQWRGRFVNRLEFILNEQGKGSVQKAREMNEQVLKALTKFDNVLEKVQACADDGRLHQSPLGVKARMSVNRMKEGCIEMEQVLCTVMPRSNAEIKRIGFDKFHMTAALVRDSFRLYGHLQSHSNQLQSLMEQLADQLEVVDRQILHAVAEYQLRIKTFSDITASLGLNDVLLKTQGFVSIEVGGAAELLPPASTFSNDSTSGMTNTETKVVVDMSSINTESTTSSSSSPSSSSSSSSSVSSFAGEEEEEGAGKEDEISLHGFTQDNLHHHDTGKEEELDRLISDVERQIEEEEAMMRKEEEKTREIERMLALLEQQEEREKLAQKEAERQSLIQKEKKRQAHIQKMKAQLASLKVQKSQATRQKGKYGSKPTDASLGSSGLSFSLPSLHCLSQEEVDCDTVMENQELSDLERLILDVERMIQEEEAMMRQEELETYEIDRMLAVFGEEESVQAVEVEAKRQVLVHKEAERQAHIQQMKEQLAGLKSQKEQVTREIARKTKLQKEIREKEAARLIKQQQEELKMKEEQEKKEEAKRAILEQKEKDLAAAREQRKRQQLQQEEAAKVLAEKMAKDAKLASREARRASLLALKKEEEELRKGKRAVVSKSARNLMAQVQARKSDLEYDPCVLEKNTAKATGETPTRSKSEFASPSIDAKAAIAAARAAKAKKRASKRQSSVKRLQSSSAAA